MNDPQKILSAYFGHENFLPAQQEIIEAVLQKRNVLALLPTGGGKSLCFQIPALAEEGICIVVSPLIALMQDQVNSLKAKRIKAMLLESGVSFEELNRLLDNCIYGGYKFLYLSPERLQQKTVLSHIEQMNVNLIAIDEVHCISQWGHDFRPAYREIPILKEIKPKVPWIALTATATQKVMEDVLSLLDLESPKVVKKSFERKNIAFQVREEEDKNYWLLKFLQKNPGTSIVYVRSRRETVGLSDFLNTNGILSAAYHGGISSEDKKIRLQHWLEEKTRVMVATNAFGMGIDKANVRSIVHYHLPESLESYYQETGRAGRDGKPSKAIILHNQSDPERVKNQFLSVLPTVKFTKKVYRKLQSYFDIAYGEGGNTFHDFNFSDFCSRYELNPIKTHNTLQLLDRASILTLSQQYRKSTQLQFLVSGNQLLLFLEKNGKYEKLTKILLRTYPGIFEHKTEINLQMSSQKSELSEKYSLQLLKELKAAEIIDFEHTKHDAGIIFLIPREDDRTINPISGYIEQQQARKKEQVAAVLHYLNDTAHCRNTQLLAYFGEGKKKDCGICSVCLEKKKKHKNQKQTYRNIQNQIMEILENEQLSSREIIEQIGFPKKDVLKVLAILLEHELVFLSNSNTYSIKNNWVK